MTTTAEKAQQLSEAYVLANRPGCRVKKLLEDSTDYLAALELEPGSPGWRDGEGFIFVSKATGRVWVAAPGDVLEKIDGMTEVGAQ